MTELAIRFFKRDIAFQPDPQYIRSLRPNIKRDIYGLDSPAVLDGAGPATEKTFLGKDFTNNVGLRMREDVGPPSPDEGRILLFGDSYTEAEGVDDSLRFYRLLEQKIAATHSLKKHWKVINAGIQNASPIQYVLLARRMIPEFKPDIVIVLHAPNDIEDDGKFEYQYGFNFDARGIPVRIKAATMLGLLKSSFALRYLEVFSLKCSTALHLWLFPAQSPDRPWEPWLPHYCSKESPLNALYREKTGHFLKEVKRLSEEGGAAFRVYLIHYMGVFPDEPAYEKQLVSLNSQMSEAGCAENVRSYNEFTESFLTESGIQFTNAYEHFLQAKIANPKVKLFGYYDYHFTPAGHRLVAEQLAQSLQGLVQ